MTWTRHGHQILGTTALPSDDLARPPVARCGGPSICPQCARDALQVRDERLAAEAGIIETVRPI